MSAHIRKGEFHAAFDLAWISCIIACDRSNHSRPHHHLVCRRRIGRSYCVLCRGEPDCTDTVFFVRFSGTFDFYQTFGHEVLQQRNHTDQCKQSDWKESSCDQDIDNLAQTGQVRINDIEWTARSADDEKIGKDTVVTIQEIRGVKLIVKQNKED